MLCILQRNGITVPLDVFCTKTLPEECYLCCVKNLTINFEQEVGIIRNTFIKAGCSFRFVNSIIESFNQEKEHQRVYSRKEKKFFLNSFLQMKQK